MRLRTTAYLPRRERCWNYGRLVRFLDYKWELSGLNPDYYHQRKEWNTSKSCHACRSTTTKRMEISPKDWVSNSHSMCYAIALPIAIFIYRELG